MLESKTPKEMKPRPAPLPRKPRDADLQSPGFGLARQERTARGAAGFKQNLTRGKLSELNLEKSISRGQKQSPGEPQQEGAYFESETKERVNERGQEMRATPEAI